MGGVQVTAQHSRRPNPQLWKGVSTTDGEYLLTLPAGKLSRYVSQRTPFARASLICELRLGAARRFWICDWNWNASLRSVVVTAEAEPLADSADARVRVGNYPQRNRAAPIGDACPTRCSRPRRFHWPHRTGRRHRFDFSERRKFQLHQSAGRWNGGERAGQRGGFCQFHVGQRGQSGSSTRCGERHLRNGRGFGRRASDSLIADRRAFRSEAFSRKAELLPPAAAGRS